MLDVLAFSGRRGRWRLVASCPQATQGCLPKFKAWALQVCVCVCVAQRREMTVLSISVCGPHTCGSWRKEDTTCIWTGALPLEQCAANVHVGNHHFPNLPVAHIQPRCTCEPCRGDEPCIVKSGAFEPALGSCRSSTTSSDLGPVFSDQIWLCSAKAHNS